MRLPMLMNMGRAVPCIGLTIDHHHAALSRLLGHHARHRSRIHNRIRWRRLQRIDHRHMCDTQNKHRNV
jgi:hypothetical protein